MPEERKKHLPVSRPTKAGRIWKRKAEPARVRECVGAYVRACLCVCSIQLSMANLCGSTLMAESSGYHMPVLLLVGGTLRTVDYSECLLGARRTF